MGDPAKVVLLEAQVKVYQEQDLLQNAAQVGKKILTGLQDLQVRDRRERYGKVDLYQ